MTLVATVCNLGLVPGELTGMAPVGLGVPLAPGLECIVDHEPVNSFTVVTSMFLHGSWSHLISKAGLPQLSTVEPVSSGVAVWAHTAQGPWQTLTRQWHCTCWGMGVSMDGKMR